MDGLPDLIYSDNSGKISVLSEGHWGAWTKKEENISFLANGEHHGPLGWELIPTTADINNDGKPDLIIGTQGGGIRYFENIKPAIVTGNDPGETWEVKVSPNPATDKISIKSNRKTEFSIFNISGIEMTTPLRSIPVHHPETINTSQWTPGIYYLQFTFENQVIVKKLVIQ
jgi:hypothetical protein